MLLTAGSCGDFSFGALMEVYVEANRENGARLAPEEPEGRQLALAEQDFYSYLHDCFFSHPGAEYCIWEEGDRYVSALRLEPYRDGLLLEALETVPDQRRKGFATRLIRAVQARIAQRGSVPVYSHVSKTNQASLNTHLRCGFEVVQDFAAYIDGSVDARACTLRYEK